jgi:uncharacterized alpha-E superfamily protein
MLSRVANSIYWMSRYIERAENIARVIDVVLQIMLDSPSGRTEQWEPLISTTGDLKPFLDKYKKPSRENVIQFLTFDRENPNSIISCLNAARENARSVREIISEDMWEQLNKYYLMVNEITLKNKSVDFYSEFYESVKIGSLLFQGIQNTTMSHGEPWHFSRLGRLLERADKTSRMLDVKYFILLPKATDVGTAFDDIQWSAVLRSASAIETYRKRHGRITADQVIGFLVLSHEFPRAINYCILNFDNSLHSISGSPLGTFTNQAEQKSGQLRADISYTREDEIIGQGFHLYLDNLQTRFNIVGEAVQETFFSLKLLKEEKISNQKEIEE